MKGAFFTSLLFAPCALFAEVETDCYWHWMNGNISKEGITADLEYMKAGGIDAAMIFDVGIGADRGEVDYGSSEWIDAVAWAGIEAERLGMELSIHNSPGYSACGGPWIKPEESMKELTWRSGKKGEPPSKCGFYREIARYPLTTADETIDIGRRLEKGESVELALDSPKEVSTVNVWRGEREKPLDPFDGPRDYGCTLKVEVFDGGKWIRAGELKCPALRARDVPGRMALKTPLKAEKLRFTSNRGANLARAEIISSTPAEGRELAIGFTATGQMVTAAPDSGRGLECDKFSRAGVDAHFDRHLDPLFAKIGKSAFKYVVIDSWEAGKQDWTDDFPSKFKEECGYDCIPWLPALTGRSVVSGRIAATAPNKEQEQGQLKFLFDYEAVKKRLFETEFLAPFAERVHKLGLLTAGEPYGDGDFEMDAFVKHLDLPMSEYWAKSHYGSIERPLRVTAAAKRHGKTYVGCEAFTAFPGDAGIEPGLENFADSIDLLKSAGIKRFIFHSIVHQPSDDSALTMGPFGTRFDRAHSTVEALREMTDCIKGAEVTVRPDVTLNRIDDRIYGFLLEHIYHSCSTGIWGEEVFNRSFEDRANLGGLYVAGKAKKGSFEANVTGDDSVIGVRDGSRDGMRTNYLDWHVAEGYAEVATGWRWYSPTAKVERIEAAVKGEGLAKIEFEGTSAAGYLDGKLAFRATCEKGGEGLVLGGSDAPFGMDFPLWKHWCLEGDAKASISEDSFNDKTSARLEVGPKGAALVQRGVFSSRKGDPITGSYWLKREGESGWTRQTFVLPDEDNESAELRLELPEGVWLVDQVSAMSESSKAAGGFRTNLLEAVKALRPAILRWPGGSFVEHYDWRGGIGPQEKRTGIPRWEDYDPLSFGTDEFLEFCGRVGAKPHMVIPIGYHNWRGWDPGATDWRARAAEWIEYIGERCDTYEIDNETWKMDPKTYVKEARQIAEAIRKTRPEATVIACGSGRLGKEGPGLDDAVREGLSDVVDFVSPHHYQEKAKFGADGVEEMRQYIVSRGMPVAFTEWNLDGQDMRTGLFAAGFLNMLERTPECPIAEAALLLRHTSAGGWNNAFINFDRRGWYYAPNAVAFKLWSESRLPRRIAAEGDFGGLDIVASASGDGRQIAVKAVNTAKNDVPLKLNLPSGYSIVRVRTMSADSLAASNTMESPNTVDIRDIGHTANSVEIPPFSATVIHFSLLPPKRDGMRGGSGVK